MDYSAYTVELYPLLRDLHEATRKRDFERALHIARQLGEGAAQLERVFVDAGLRSATME